MVSAPFPTGVEVVAVVAELTGLGGKPPPGAVGDDDDPPSPGGGGSADELSALIRLALPSKWPSSGLGVRASLEVRQLP